MPEDNSDKQSKYNPESVDDAMKIIAALEKRLGEREATIDSLKGDVQKLSEGLKAIQDGQQKELEAQGNFKTLAEKLQADLSITKPKAERAEALEAVIRQANEATIARVPEARRGLIPVDYAPEKLQMWLAANAALLTRDPAPDFNAGEGTGDGKPPAKLTDEERKAASAFGVKPEVLEALKAKDSSKT